MSDSYEEWAEYASRQRAKVELPESGTLVWPSCVSKEKGQLIVEKLKSLRPDWEVFFGTKNGMYGLHVAKAKLDS
jgi:hypothetical protein